jgi:hypothetical protein
LAITMRGDIAGLDDRFETFARLRVPAAFTDIIIAGSKIAAQPSQLAVLPDGFAPPEPLSFFGYSQSYFAQKIRPGSSRLNLDCS